MFFKRELEYIPDTEEKICPLCLNLLADQTINEVLTSLAQNTDLVKYDSPFILTAIQLPIILNVRQLSIWFAVVERFPQLFKSTEAPDVPIKEVLKFRLNPKICEQTGREFDIQGVMVNIGFGVRDESTELIKLLKVKPNLFSERDIERKKHILITRNIFDKHFTPKTVEHETYAKHFEVPPTTTIHPIAFTEISITGPTVFVAGRYNKFSRTLSQTPWVLEGKRVMEDSVSELIVEGLRSHFTVKADNFVFSSSGREDVDVRCLGPGRPFVLEIMDSNKSLLPDNVAATIEASINGQMKGISVCDLQMVKREDLVHIKTGEEKKKKIYRALCHLKTPVTREILQKLTIPDGFVTNQWTPLRVLHRRPLLLRPRAIFSTKPSYYRKENGDEVLIIDVVTQAGTYIKELVHGDFGRTEPNFSSLIDEEMDILALDVIRIDLDWPPPVNRGEKHENGNH